MTEVLDTRTVTDAEVFEAIKARLRVGWIQGNNGAWEASPYKTQPFGEVCLYGAYLAVCNSTGDSALPVTSTQRGRIWGCIQAEAVSSARKLGHGEFSAIGFNDKVARSVQDVIDLVARARASCSRSR